MCIINMITVSSTNASLTTSGNDCTQLILLILHKYWSYCSNINGNIAISTVTAKSI